MESKSTIFKHHKKQKYYDQVKHKDNFDKYIEDYKANKTFLRTVG